MTRRPRIPRHHHHSSLSLSSIVTHSHYNYSDGDGEYGDHMVVPREALHYPTVTPHVSLLLPSLIPHHHHRHRHP